MNVAATPVRFLIVMSGVPERPVASPVTAPVIPPVAVIAPVKVDTPVTDRFPATEKSLFAAVTFVALNVLYATNSMTSPF